jgi:hypothetical protein
MHFKILILVVLKDFIITENSKFLLLRVRRLSRTVKSLQGCYHISPLNTKYKHQGTTGKGNQKTSPNSQREAAKSSR